MRISKATPAAALVIMKRAKARKILSALKLATPMQAEACVTQPHRLSGTGIKLRNLQHQLSTMLLISADLQNTLPPWCPQSTNF